MSGIIPPQFHVSIPDDRVALYPPEKRGESKLLVVDCAGQSVIHVGHFRDITNYVSNDLIVLNETKVLPARVFGNRATGGGVELLFLVTSLQPLADSESPDQVKQARVAALLSTSRRPQPGLVIQLPDNATFQVVDRSEHGGWEGIWTTTSGKDFEEWLTGVGVPPLPPYIKRPVEVADHERYQTVYAHTPGSIAAPTAGLHFTPEMLKQLKNAGAEIARLTLNVGWGTFEPIKTTDLNQHVMHSESYDIPTNTAKLINSAKNEHRKILAVGTTSIRALEAAAKISMPIQGGAGDATLFIYPPYQFKIVDKVLTNFHRPDSTLLQLIAALTGWELLNEVYQRALDEDFHFFSYGDAMLIV